MSGCGRCWLDSLLPKCSEPKRRPLANTFPSFFFFCSRKAKIGRERPPFGASTQHSTPPPVGASRQRSRMTLDTSHLRQLSTVFGSVGVQCSPHAYGFPLFLDGVSKVSRAHSQLAQYEAKYGSRLKGKNAFYVGNILRLLRSDLKLLKKRVSLSPREITAPKRQGARARLNRWELLDGRGPLAAIL